MAFSVFGAVVDEMYAEFPTFEGAVTPTVADVNGDGILDIVAEVAGGETVVYLGCGGEGAAATPGSDGEGDWSFLSSPSFASLGGLTTALPFYRDTPPVIADYQALREMFKNQ